MEFNEYQKKSQYELIAGNYPELMYTTLALTGEAGEIADKVKKIYRDEGGIVSQEKRQDITREMGDLLWYMGRLAIHLGVSFDDVARENLEKLSKRTSRGTLSGAGDNR
ncbi:nucleoside triphosphate pyrophosphohydrolase family protein [Candidatus Wolfebacteria bacterium]|nr:nucleoside triphosphate pyrophosphohydrolase family protein [Candidatus Wolfebacteria bacterium]